jgi:hypothetical protein
MATLRLNDIVVVSSHYRTDRAFVVGSAFGPRVLVVGGDVSEALDTFTGRYCEPVDGADPALVDYGGLEKAMDEGEVRWTDEGARWVDHYEWLREFRGPDAVRRAGQFFREC